MHIENEFSNRFSLIRLQPNPDISVEARPIIFYRIFFSYFSCFVNNANIRDYVSSLYDFIIFFTQSDMKKLPSGSPILCVKCY